MLVGGNGLGANVLLRYSRIRLPQIESMGIPQICAKFRDFNPHLANCGVSHQYSLVKCRLGATTFDDMVHSYNVANLISQLYLFVT